MSESGGRGEASLGKRVGGGMAWMLLATAAGKSSTFVAQIVLGLVLAEGDFGVYAAAIGLAAFIRAVRDGGVRQILIQRGSARWDGLAGPAFWLATAVNGAMALVMGGIAAAIFFAPIGGGTAYADPRLPAVLGVLALSLAVSSPALIFQAKLSVDLRFKSVAGLNTQQALVRNGSMIVFALLGFGPLSFALPQLVATLYLNVRGYMLTRDRLWSRGVRLRMWPAIISRAKWLVLMAFALATLLQGDYLVLGWLTPAALVGLYFFAYQLTSQIQVLLGVNLQMVLFPSLSKLKNEPVRFREATLRSVRVLSAFACWAGVLLALVYEPLEAMIWGGKWAATVLAVQAMAISFPFRMLTNVLNSALMAQGQFKALAGYTLAAGAGIMAVAAAAALVGASAMSGTFEALVDLPEGVSALEAAPEADLAVGLLALCTAAFFGVGITAIVARGLARVGLAPGRMLGACLPAWLTALAVGAAVYGLDRLLCGGWHPAARFVTISVAFTGLYTLAARVVLQQAIRDTLHVMPGRLANPARRVLRMPRSGAAGGDGSPV